MKYAVVAVIVIGLLVFSSVGMGETVSKGNITYGIKPKLVWNRTWDRGVGTDDGRSIMLTQNNSILIAGITNNTPNKSISPFILKYNANGTQYFYKLINTTDSFDQAIIENDDTLFAIGTTNYSETTHHRIVISHLNNNGTILWKYIFNNTNESFGSSLCITKDKKIIAVGYTTLASNMTDYDTIIALDYSGKILWNRLWTNGVNNGIGSVVLDDQSNIYTGGTMNIPINGLLVKFNQTGDFLWKSNCIYSNSNYFHICYTNKSIVCGGSSNHITLIARYNEFGNNSWIKTDMSGYIQGIIPVSNDGFITTGNDEGSTYSAFTAKYDLSGNRLWNASWKQSVVSQGNAITMDKQQNIYVIGGYGGYGVGTSGSIFLLKYSEVNIPEFITILLPAITLIALFLVANSTKKSKNFRDW